MTNVRVLMTMVAAGCILPLSAAITQAQEPPSRVRPENANALSLLTAIKASDLNEVEKILTANPTLVQSTDLQGYPILQQAVRWRDAPMVKLLLDKGADINALDREGKTPLHHAVWSRQEAMVRLLLERGADLNVKNTPRPGALPPQNVLYSALHAGDANILKLLIEKGASVTNLRDGTNTRIGDFLLDVTSRAGDLELTKYLLQKTPAPHPYSILQHPIERGDKAMVELLLDNQVSPITSPLEPDEERPGIDAPLHWAARAGQKEIAELLLKRGADLKAINHYARTPLAEAVSARDHEMVRFFLEKGAAAIENRPDRSGALRHLIPTQDRALIDLLVKGGVRLFDPLVNAILMGDLETVKKRALTPNENDSLYNYAQEKISPLHIAALMGQTAIVQWLLENGFTPKLTTKTEQTPLHWAVLSGSAPTVQLLLDKGADVNAVDSNGQTPLHRAALTAGREIISPLLDKGAQLDAPILISVRDKSNNENKKEPIGMTPLLRAAWAGNSEAVATFVERGANINYADSSGLTPFLAAASVRNAPSLKLLLDKGADINQLDKTRNTALHNVVEGRGPSVPLGTQAPPLPKTEYDARAALELLLERGMKVQTWNANGYSPLDIAVRKGDTALTGLLLDKGALLNGAKLMRFPMGIPYPPSGYARAFNEGATPLHQAVALGDAAMVKFLLSRGADKNALDAFGRTALDMAERRGEATRQYIDFPFAPGIDYRWGPDISEPDGFLQREFARHSNQAQIARLLREAGAQSGTGWFFEAVRSGAKFIVQNALQQKPELAQLQMGANPAVNGRGGYLREPLPNMALTPLTIATRENQNAMVQFLLQQGGASPSANANALSPNADNLLTAARAGNLELVRQLLENGYDVNGRDNQGKTALHAAARSGSLELVKLLVERGADVNIKDNRGMTPVTEAMVGQSSSPRGSIIVSSQLPDGSIRQTSSNAIANYLFEKGAQSPQGTPGNQPPPLTAPQGSQTTPVTPGAIDSRSLYEIIGTGNLAALQEQLKANPDLLKDKKGGEPLFFNAVRRNQAEIIKWMVKNGADINTVDARGRNVLYVAIESNRVDFLPFLLDLGADINLDPDKDQPERWSTKTTPAGPLRTRILTRPLLYAAITKGTKETVTLLLDRGAKLDARDAEGNTPLKWAEQNQKTAIVELLKARGATE